jgi:hypothetical protein
MHCGHSRRWPGRQAGTSAGPAARRTAGGNALIAHGVIDRATEDVAGEFADRSTAYMLVP